MAADPRPGAVESAAAGLYALAPDAFIPERNRRAADAAARGDRDLASALRRLPKPSMAAWAVNLLVSRTPEALARVAGMRGELERAQLSNDGTGLRRLGRERRELVGDLAGRARTLVRDTGYPFTAATDVAVRDTLTAAILRAGAADAVAAGMLAKPLAPGDSNADGGAGFLPAASALAEVTDIRSAPTRRRAVTAADTAGAESAEEASEDPERAQTARSDENLARRTAAAETAVRKLRVAVDDAGAAAAAVERLTEERDGLRARLREAEQRLAAAQKEAAGAAGAAAALAGARRSARAADEALRHAEQQSQRHRPDG
jgi:hypothetical protein